MRVISLVPSLSEYAEFLCPGIVCGRTRFCIHPAGLKERAAILGGTKNPDVPAIIELKPDLVLANREENRREDIEALEAAGVPVLTTEIDTVADALREMRRIGQALQVPAKADALCAEIAGIEPPGCTRWIRTVYLIWRAPWMAVGGDTYISDVMHRFSLENALGDRSRYPVLEPDELALLDPELVLLSSEPYPFKERHANELRALLPNARITFANGEAFSWYGSRMVPAFRELAVWRTAVGS